MLIFNKTLMDISLQSDQMVSGIFAFLEITLIFSINVIVLQEPGIFVLKVWSTVKIRGTRVPQNATVPVGRPRPYSIIILNMRSIPEASLRASSQITATSYILERHL